MSRGRGVGGCFTCHGCVAQEACDFLLTELLFLIGQQLVDELPKDLLGRCVQHRVDIHDEGINVPKKGSGARESSLRGSPYGWVAKGGTLSHRIQPHALPQSLKGSSEQEGRIWAQAAEVNIPVPPLAS